MQLCLGTARCGVFLAVPSSLNCGPSGLVATAEVLAVGPSGLVASAVVNPSSAGCLLEASGRR